jgi:hypothetical protein
MIVLHMLALGDTWPLMTPFTTPKGHMARLEGWCFSSLANVESTMFVPFSKNAFPMVSSTGT